MKLADFNNYIVQNAMLMGEPVAGFFELTSRCNFRCKMCYICGLENHNELAGKELTTQQWIDLGIKARDAGALYITLTGGEILLRKDFWEIYEALTHMGLIITLFTNASLLTDELIRKLANNPPLNISITVYGASAETYGKVTGNPDAYEKVVTNIRKLVAAGLKVQLKTTVIKYNSGEFQQLAEFARSFGLNMGLVNYVSPRREGEGTDPLANRLDPMELLRYEKNADDVIKRLHEQHKDEKKQSIIVDDVMANEKVDDYLKNIDTSAMKETAFRCSAGKCGFWLSWEGKLFPCGLLTELSSDPLEDSFENAWNKVRELCQKVPACQECVGCEYYSKCMSCPARLKLETGSYDKAASYLCEYTKARDEVFTSR